jgi:hypothetical protein
MTEDTETTPYSLYLDLIEGALGNALVDINHLRSLEKQKDAAKDRRLMLWAALDNCGSFLRQLEALLDDGAKARRVQMQTNAKASDRFPTI